MERRLKRIGEKFDERDDKTPPQNPKKMMMDVFEAFREASGYEDDELYKLHLHAPKSDMNKLWAELRESLDNEGAGYSILIGKYRIRGPPPYCLAWKNKQ